MNINLGKQFEDYIKNKVKSGLYKNKDEVIQDALKRMKDSEEQKRLKTISNLLTVGEEQIKRGDGIKYKPDFMDQAMKKAIENSKSGKIVRNEVKPQR